MIIRAEPYAIARFDLEDVFSLAVKGRHGPLHVHQEGL